MKTKRFAVVLAGCGFIDGAEIQEAVFTLLAIDEAGGTCECFAPDIKQYHVVDHVSGRPEAGTRNVLTEAARIARGRIRELSQFNPADFDALVFPGGIGVAKNLCSFATEGAACRVNPGVEKCILGAHKAGLPIGALCIAPVLLARVLGKGTLTIGTDPGTGQAIGRMGATHQPADGAGIVIDRGNKLVTSPCYMLDSPVSVVARGARNVVNALLEMT